jgi:sulfide:quinone oxidoreductase
MAGITVAARLRRTGEHDVAIIEPSDRHYYQPIWTLIGPGIARPAENVQPEASVLPRGVHWIHGTAAEIDPGARAVALTEGTRIGYDFLVVAPGIQIDWHRIPGLVDALRTAAVSSIFDLELATRTWRMIDRFRGGTALFTSAATPIKCGGAPQKIMYLAADTLRLKGILQDAHIVFGHAGAVIFGVQPFADMLARVVERYGIDVRYRHELVEVRPATREAVFLNRDGADAQSITIPYDMLHVTPPMSAPDFLKGGPLAADDPLGWVRVDKHTLQNPTYPEVFALADACHAPTAKTGAAVRKQAPVLVANLRAVIAGKEPIARYNGYSSCPLLTARNRMLLAEFDYDHKPTPSIPFIDTFREQFDVYLLKRYGLPWMYWHVMLKGKA